MKGYKQDDKNTIYLPQQQNKKQVLQKQRQTLPPMQMLLQMSMLKKNYLM